MRLFTLICLLFVILWLPSVSRADAPATEFFVIETVKLEKLAPTDAKLDALSRGDLAEISLATGWYAGGLSVEFSTAAFRLGARFTEAFDLTNDPAAEIGYNIAASTDPKIWNVAHEVGIAKRLGKQLITEDWRKQRVTVVLRFLDLKQ